MIVTDITDSLDYPNCLRSQADEEGLTRSGGLHLTPIIKDIEQTIKPRDLWCTDEELAFFGAGGFMWERVYSEAMRDSLLGDELLVRPGEVTLDGITGSPTCYGSVLTTSSLSRPNARGEDCVNGNHWRKISGHGWSKQKPTASWSAQQSPRSMCSLWLAIGGRLCRVYERSGWSTPIES